MSLADILGKSKGRPSYVADSRWVLPSCLMGWEFEYEGVKNSELPRSQYSDLWAFHEENSLKDDGAEYVFSTPLLGKDAYNAIQWLTDYAAKSEWKCTKRTGIHCHVDIRDLEVAQLAGMTILYTAIEPILYHWIGDARDVSHFCIPLYRADDALVDVCSILRSAHIDVEARTSATLKKAENFQRYAGYNLQALWKFGSVEYRQMQTTHDLLRIVDWGNIILSLKAAAFKLPYSDGAVVRMLEGMRVEDILAYIFPENLASKLYYSTADEEFHTYGLPGARDIAVHGCSSRTDWIRKTYPKGEHQGYKKWQASSVSSSPKRKSTAEAFEEIRALRGMFDPPQVGAAVGAAQARRVLQRPQRNTGGRRQPHPRTTAIRPTGT